MDEVRERRFGCAEDKREEIEINSLGFNVGGRNPRKTRCFRMKLGVVVEGLGDRRATPCLIAKSAALIGLHVFASEIVEGGGWDKQKKPNELEKNCLLVASNDDIAGILVLVDLEDGCPVEELNAIHERVEQLSDRIGLPIDICFCQREYETWFLETLAEIAENTPELDWQNDRVQSINTGVRGAKEEFSRCINSRYRPSIDQEKFTKKVPFDLLRLRSRSYCRLLNCLTRLVA